MINKIISAYKQRKGPSILLKWSLASALFIFIVFTTFAVIVFNVSTNLIMLKERDSLQRTVENINQKLSQSKDVLTVDSVQEYFGFEFITGLDETDQVYLNRDDLVEGLLQNSASYYIYNKEEQVIFGTNDLPPNLIDTKIVKPTVLSLGDELGCIVAEPIYSKETHEKIGYVQGILILDNYSDINSKLVKMLIIVEIISLIFSVILGAILANYFLKPIRVLRNNMVELKDDPHLEAQIEPIQTRDELEDLSNIFEELMDKIKDYIEQSDQFISDVSHELRTPIAIVEGHLKMLDRWGKNDPEVLDESIQSSLQSIQRMKHLIQEMLELSKTGHIEERKRELTEAVEVVNKVYNDFKVLCGNEFEITLDNQLGFSDIVLVNEERFEQVLIILLDNAVKYSTDDKRIKINAWSSADSVMISVQDFGAGISRNDQDKIFNRFYRVDQARTNSTSGNGLGLSIAWQIIEGYQGVIKVDSQERIGSKFTIVLPKVLE